MPAVLPTDDNSWGVGSGDDRLGEDDSSYEGAGDRGAMGGGGDGRNDGGVTLL